jgi:uncharacterized protein (DUF433 family)
VECEITVGLIVNPAAEGVLSDQILEDYPDLEAENIR